MINRISNLALALLNEFVSVKSSEQKLSRPLRQWISWSIKLGISATAIYYIAAKLIAESAALSTISIAISELSILSLFGFILAGLVLVIVNWGMEVVKWNILIGPRLETLWRTAVKGVLSGTTIGVFTPNRYGEFIGRILALGPQQRVTGALLSFVNSLAQTMATLTFGLLGFIYLIQTLALDTLGQFAVSMIQALLVGLWITSLFLYFKLDHLRASLVNSSKLHQFREYIKSLTSFSPQLLNRLYVLSLVRFISFVGQYIVVFSLLFTDPDLLSIAGIAMLTLFSTTILSFIPIPNLLLRQTVALSYFGLFDFDLVPVSIAVFCVWIINIALPAVVGSIVMLTYRIFRAS